MDGDIVSITDVANIMLVTYHVGCFYKIFASLLILLFLSIVFEDIFHIHDWPSLETVTPYHFGLGTKINHKNILFYETKTHVAKLLSFFQVSNLMKKHHVEYFL